MRKGNFRASFYFVLFFLLPGKDGTLLAQQAAFTASVSVTSLTQHSVFEVRFELENASGSDFQPPDFKEFKVVGGPSTGSSTVIVNGAVSRSQSWSYTLLAAKLGKFTIGPASVVAGRKKLTTRPLPIEVLALKDMAKPGSSSASREPVMLKAELDTKEYYPGHQIILTYRLLFRENVQTVSTLDEDDYADFFIQNFSDFSREATYETINGQQFTSRIIKSLALFAHQSGTYTIEPMVMNVGINAPFPGNQGFFTMRRVQDVHVASEPVTITILPLPANPPKTFSGAVGQYEMSIIPGKTEMSTDQAFSFKIEFVGNGDARRWEVPLPIANGDFETYEPRILEDKVVDAGNKVSHFRSVIYQMIPAVPGDYKVFVPFTFFDPERKQYITITSDTAYLQVAQGIGQLTDSLSSNQDTSNVLQLMPVRAVWLKDKFWVSVPHLALFALILFGAVMGLFFACKKRRENQIPEAGKIRMAAGHKARSQYDLLESSLPPVPANVFFEKATEVYYKFLMERFAIPSSELDEERLSAYLTRNGVPEEVADRAKAFFNQCLTVRYGAIPGGYSRDEMLRECRALTHILG